MVKVTWQHVVLILGLIGAAIVVAWIRPESLVMFLGLIVAVLAALGLVKLGQIEAQTNSGQDRLVGLATIISQQADATQHLLTRLVQDTINKPHPAITVAPAQQLMTDGAPAAPGVVITGTLTPAPVAEPPSAANAS